jgi:hypothetical protein
VSRNIDATTLRRMLLEAMEIPVSQQKREAAKAIKKAESGLNPG